MALNFDNLHRCNLTLARSLQTFDKCEAGSIDYEVARNAVIKSFELTLETAGKLLGKVLKEYVGSPKTVDGWVFKDLLRNAAKHGLMTSAELERWLAYRDARNSTAHDYGEAFAEHTLGLIRHFQEDAVVLHSTLVAKHG